MARVPRKRVQQRPTSRGNGEGHGACIGTRPEVMLESETLGRPVDRRRPGRRLRGRYGLEGDVPDRAPARGGGMRRGLPRGPHPPAGGVRGQGAPLQPHPGSRGARQVSAGGGDNLDPAASAHRAGVRLRRHRGRRALPGHGAARGRAARGPGRDRARPSIRAVRSTSSSRSPRPFTRPTSAASCIAI